MGFLAFCLVFLLFYFKCWRTLVFLAVTAFNALFIGLGFLATAIVTWMFYPDAVREWTLLPSWFSHAVDTAQTIPGVLGALWMVPADCLRWIYDISFKQGPWPMPVVMTLITAYAFYMYWKYIDWWESTLTGEPKAWPTK